MLTITNREAMLGPKYSGRDVDADGIKYKSLKIEVTRLMLDENELNALLGEPHAYRSLYNTRRDGEPEPYLKCLKALELNSSWEGAYVRITAVDMEVVFKSAKLSKIRLELQTGGMTALSCNIEGEVPLDASLPKIIERTASSIECEIRAHDPSSQKDLPLNQHGTGEQPEATERRRNSTRQRAH